MVQKAEANEVDTCSHQAEGEFSYIRPRHPARPLIGWFYTCSHATWQTRSLFSPLSPLLQSLQPPLRDEGVCFPQSPHGQRRLAECPSCRNCGQLFAPRTIIIIEHDGTAESTRDSGTPCHFASGADSHEEGPRSAQ